MQNEWRYCHGGAENSLLLTCWTAFFTQLLKGDVEPAGSTPCKLFGLVVRIRDA